MALECSAYRMDLEKDIGKLAKIIALESDSAKNRPIDPLVAALRGRIAANAALLTEETVQNMRRAMAATSEGLGQLKQVLDAASSESTKLTKRLFWVALFSGFAAAASAVAAIIMASRNVA